MGVLEVSVDDSLILVVANREGNLVVEASNDLNRNIVDVEVSSGGKANSRESLSLDSVKSLLRTFNVLSISSSSVSTDHVF